MKYELHNGDCLEILRSMPDGSVGCIVTSPPYWGLRDYGVEGQIGLEPTPDAYVSRMVEVFREARRVLADDGTCFVNLGDSYASSPASGGAQSNRMTGGEHKRTPNGEYRRPLGLKPKDLVGIPWRVAFALQADGWWLRQDIIWHKPNPMPESVRDRCTKAHEYIFLLTKSERYWWDVEAVREDAKPWNDGVIGGDPLRGSHVLDVGSSKSERREYAEIKGANRRSVWAIASEPYAGAHFACFPTELPRLCILAGCKPDAKVMDIFAGSGTTLQVAMELGHDAVGIELNPKYCELIRQRCATAAAQRRMF